MVEDWQSVGFGLYVHWPFCEAKCPYCDFNSHVSRFIDHSAWVVAYLSALNEVAALTGPRVLNTIFFGGGTPSLMEPSTVAAVIDRANQLWTFSNDLEVTLEANPSSVEAAKFKAFRDAGVNRISLGIQALNNHDLQKLGRLHDRDAALSALDIAQTTFDRVSFDLMYGRQDQSLSMWEDELEEALLLGTKHLSLYQLTIEEGTAFGARFRVGSLKGLPDENCSADLFALTQRLCEDAGLHQYEISNFAADCDEAKHNLIYWRYGDYAGIGPGAHGRLTVDSAKWTTEQPRSPDTWLKHHGATDRQSLSPDEEFFERLLMGLRIREGLDLGRVSRATGLAPKAESLNALAADGWVVTDGQMLRVTAKGMPLLNTIIEKLSEV